MSKSQETPEQLYAAALALVEQNQPEEALEQAEKLWGQVQNGSVTEALPAVNLLGEISIELGDVDSARAYFEKAVTLDPEGKIPETMGGGAEKFLWLAQLCEDGGKSSVTWFERGIQALQHEISELEAGRVSGYDDESLLLMRVEKKRKLANALCGIVEVYMTDLSWEDDAEARCENLVTQAMSVEDETSPEVLQTLASVRLSQERKEDARSALERSIATWKDLEPEDPAVPDFATRISLARLLMEAELDHRAMFVLQRLIQEDDQSVEAWYLGGWCQYLIAERSRNKGASEQQTNGEANTEMNLDQDKLNDETLKGSRHWLNKALKLYKLLEYEDERLFEHTKELVAGLDTVLGPSEDDDAEAAEGAYEQWDGIEDDDEANEGEEDEDEEMQDQ
ncbi:putative assembly chaperone of rpl4 [Acrodontium crateriforme]|uniref:Assembly chaperone of rpl4 n=1 Tax=Acrodontium crateriforme TaxID=150365 RepID=A0AAQ3M195_9PEZI|nr:putative assembly chaperone of rpl4 [Acrodontium crateriforme]